MKQKLLLSGLLMAMGTSAVAQSSADEIALLKKQIEMLSQKIEKLENKTAQVEEKQEEQTQVVEEKVKVLDDISWASRISFNGDFRYRYEYIDEREREVRNRNRIRLRLGATAQVNEKLKVGLQLATGGDNPVSANQTLDGSFSTKDIGVDLAYFDWSLTDALTLTGGKMKNPFFRPEKSPVMWDNDLRPEGISLKFDSNGFSGNISGFSVEERSSADDTLLFGGQVYKTFDFDDSSFIAGVGYYDYQDIKGTAPLLDGNPRGNTVDSNGLIANDFNIAEASAQYKTSLAQLPFTIFGTYYKNTQADDLDTAFSAGVALGKVDGRGSWRVEYSYLDVEADAVIGLFNDSNFGAGDTDAKGHFLRAGYGLSKNTSLAMAYIANELNQSSDEQTDYDRFQLDYKIKFK